jgi:hypothetical protein
VTGLPRHAICIPLNNVEGEYFNSFPSKCHHLGVLPPLYFSHSLFPSNVTILFLFLLSVTLTRAEIQLRLGFFKWNINKKYDHCIKRMATVKKEHQEYHSPCFECTEEMHLIFLASCIIYTQPH